MRLSEVVLKGDMYAKFFKRLFDFILSLLALIVLLPIMLALIVIGTIKMKGNPFFTQLRPGENERIFKLIKFRTMTCEKDNNGKLLPDEKRLTTYGKILRSSSLDELPELINILVGQMSIVGPRPQLVRDMVFMTEEQRHRHDVRPGLSGLAQVNGRNNMTWEKKFEYDLQYIKKITMLGDIKIIVKTVFQVFKQDGITEDGMATAEDLGDYLLHSGMIDNDTYLKKQENAEELIRI
ncbi:MAG: sugar transferase [Victivallaceae bacterium]